MSFDSYWRRFGFCPRQIAVHPHADLGIVVVIPCHNEPDLVGSLAALWRCDRPGCAVEVIVVINAPGKGCEAVQQQNLKTWNEASAWIVDHRDDRFCFHLLHFPALPPKHAGVGLARKIGMDEAVGRFGEIGRSAEGLVVGFDADCRCEANYLRSLETHFRQHPKSPGCSIYFEHPLSGPLEAEVYQAITAYELHLRYYIQGLRYAGFPHAYHTIGSCMAVRAEVYQAQGGMNKRRAGEDFYFLHKIMPLGGFTELTTTTVLPSPRVSNRVPFGTGQAVADHLRCGETRTYPLSAFRDLRIWIEQVPALFRADRPSVIERLADLPESIRTFLEANAFEQAWREIRENTVGERSFGRRFFRWMDGFRVMKYLHHARDHYYGEGLVAEEARRLFALVCSESEPPANRSLREWLMAYRQLDRVPMQAPSGSPLSP